MSLLGISPPSHWTGSSNLVELTKGSAEYNKVEKEFRDNLKEGDAMYWRKEAAAKLGGQRNHAAYISDEIKADSQNFTLRSVTRVQNKKEWLQHMLEEEKDSHTYTVYHGTDPRSVDGILKGGFSKYRTQTAAYGKGVYFDPFGAVSMHHAIQNKHGNKCAIIVCRLVYKKIGSTSNSDTGPPPGFDCGACCRVDEKFPKPCIIVSFRDAQVLPEYIIEFQWNGRA
jgi:hypothetical protein